MLLKVLLPDGRVKSVEGEWEGEGSPAGWRVLVRVGGKGTTGVVLGYSQGRKEGEIVSFPDRLPLTTVERLSLVRELSSDYLLPAGILFFKLLPAVFLWKEEEVITAGGSVGLDAFSASVLEYVKARKEVKESTLSRRFGKTVIDTLLRKGILKSHRKWTTQAVEENYYRLKVSLGEALARLRSPRKKRLVVFLSAKEWTGEEEVLIWGFERRDLGDLVRKGIVERGKGRAHFEELKKNDFPKREFARTGDRILLLWERREKALGEVARRAISTLREGGSSLILFADLGELTALSQMLSREVGKGVKEIHSGVSPKTLMKNWFSSCKEPTILLGSYIASLCPLRDLRLIALVGESLPGVRLKVGGGLDLRKLTLMLSKKTSADLLFVSDAPSVGSYLLVKTGRARLEGPPKNLPEVEIIKREAGEVLTAKVRDEVSEERGSVLFLVPKQGYSYAYCPRCDSPAACPFCGTFLTYSRKEDTLRCIACKYLNPDLSCPECGGDLQELGFGIEKVVQEVERWVGIRKSYHFATHPPWGRSFDIVAVLSADMLLSIPSYRSKEELFIYLCRAMLHARKKVFIQTLLSREKTFAIFRKKNLLSFYERELEERKKHHLPPFWRLVLIKTKRDIKSDILRELSPHIRTSLNVREGVREYLVSLRGREGIRRLKRLKEALSGDIIEVRLDPL